MACEVQHAIDTNMMGDGTLRSLPTSQTGEAKSDLEVGTPARASAMYYAPVVLGMMYMAPGLSGSVPEVFKAGVLDTSEYATPSRPVVALFVVTMIVGCIYRAVHISLYSTRTCGTKSWEYIVMMLIGDMILLPYYALYPDVESALFFDAKSKRNHSLLAAAPALQSYRMTFWLRNVWLSLGTITLRELWRWQFDREGYLSMVRRQVLPLPDGGQIALDWYRAGDTLPSTAPLLFIAPTLMGDGRSEPTRDLAENFLAKGWRVCCCVKRGGGYLDPLPLTDWTPPCPLSYDHIVQGLEVARESFPESYLAIAGLSAGGNWVRRYCAASGAENLADAAMALDAGWNWHETVTCVDADCPFIGLAMGTAMAQPLLRAAAKSQPPAWLDIKRLTAAQQESWMAVMDVAHRASTGLSLADSFGAHCDRNDLDKLPRRSAVPLLVLASYGDACCPDYYIKDVDKMQDLPLECPNTIVCISKVGAHCSRPTGVFGTGNWIAEASLQFFNAVKDTSISQMAVPEKEIARAPNE